MTELIKAEHRQIVNRCRVGRLKKDGCAVSMKGAPTQRIVVDLDCGDLQPVLRGERRCDYLFIGKEGKASWVSPIEMKSGGFKAADVIDQLQSGASAADALLPGGTPFQFVPVLAHRGVHRRQRDRFRSGRIHLRGQTRQVVLIRCGEPLKTALDSGWWIPA